MRTHQYTISASSPLSSVPAATVRPSIDTSQEESALCCPSYGTAGRHRSVFSALKCFLPPPLLRYGSVRKVSRTYSRSRWYPCGHPIHARHHPFRRKRSPFYLCRQQSRRHAKTSCLLYVLRKSATCQETSCRTSIFCETARTQTQHRMTRMLRLLKRTHRKAVSKI